VKLQVRTGTASPNTFHPKPASVCVGVFHFICVW
jgi:hypothetical protein